MELLENPVRPYAWGSRTVIAELRGEPTPSPHPEAEMWLGAHPGDPSHLVGRDGRRTSLLDAVRADPEGLLGADRSAKWSGNLPYLLKVLAADEPLSLQAHPSAAQAAEGFARENAAGIPRRRAHPQLPRREPQARADLRAHRVPRAGRLPRDPRRPSRCCARWTSPSWPRTVALLAAQPDAAGLRALFTTWITLPQSVLDRRAARAADRLRAARPARPASSPARRGWRWSCPSATRATRACSPRCCSTWSCWRRARRCTCPPATCTPTCPGAGVELMANSDNVLRGGLTSKHVDVAELLRVLDFTPRSAAGAAR